MYINNINKNFVNADKNQIYKNNDSNDNIDEKI